MARGMSVGDFLGHKPQGGGGGQFLRGWKKRSPPAVNTFLHTRAPIIALWQHNLPRLHEKDGKVEVWGGTWNCIEDEDILRSQYIRDRDTGEREHPPEVCPLCLLNEEIRRMIDDGVLDFAAPIFKWVGDDANKGRVLHAAGIFNGFKDDKDLTKKQKMSMKKFGISRKEAWKENVTSKCNYLFVVVDADNLKDGVQIAIETTLLGDKVKEVIRDQMTALGEDDGNPLKNPFCIRWEHRPSEKEFQKRYHALPMPRVKLTGEITQLIESAPPSIEGIISPGNIAKLRADLESHALDALKDIDWDAIFAPAEAWVAEQADAKTKELEPDKVPDVKGVKKKLKKADKALLEEEEDDEEEDEEEAEEDDEEAEEDDEEEDEEEEDVEMVACDACKGEMPEDVLECPHCGAKYDEDGNLTFDPRKKAKKKSKKKVAKKKAASKSRKPAEDDEDDEDDDDIPF